MIIDRKSDNEKFVRFESGLLRMWDNLHEVTDEEGDIAHEGDMYESYEQGDNEEILAVEREKWQKHVTKAQAERAQKLLDATDYKIIKAMEKLLVAQGLVESREGLRGAVRMG